MQPTNRWDIKGEIILRFSNITYMNSPKKLDITNEAQLNISVVTFSAWVIIWQTA